MESLINSITFILLIILIASPILVLVGIKKKNSKNVFILYIISSIFITFILTLIFAWWSDISDHILLNFYGYDFDAMNNVERFKKVLPENLGRVKELEMKIMGVGWPLKAFMTYFFILPFVIIIFFSENFLYRYIRRKNS